MEFLSMETLEKINKSGMDWATIEKLNNCLDGMKINETKYLGGWYGDYFPITKKIAGIINETGIFHLTFHHEKVLDMHGYDDNNYICVIRLK